MNAHPREFNMPLPSAPEAEAASCSVLGCCRKRHSYGYCSMHSKRFKRHGDPLGGRTFDGEPSAWLDDHMKYEGDDCVSWPFAKCSNGYPQMVVSRKRKYVTRIICEMVHGPAPSPRHEAAHSCGNGHLSCVTKAHISWKTPIENSADKEMHGTVLRGASQNGAKLTENDVREIRKLKGKFTYDVIAEMFGVSPGAISGVFSGRNWGWLK